MRKHLTQAQIEALREQGHARWNRMVQRDEAALAATVVAEATQITRTAVTRATDEEN